MGSGPASTTTSTSTGTTASRIASGRSIPKIGVFDATMLVMGGIVGAGIFSNPAVVANMVHSGVLMMT
ncbi:MAG TPA: hypothetical protein VLI40_13320, partial [Gemmatimonadaceae bacterium]|nr:hypothetical protein [Gemmatimonadaceae bacterium]